MELTEEQLKAKRLEELQKLLSEEDKDKEDKEDDEEEEYDDDSEEEDEEEKNEHLDAIFSGETLSEEFKQKVGTIFSAAVQVEVDRQVAEAKLSLEKEYGDKLDEAKAELKGEVDAYLGVVVEQWVAKNETQVKNQLKLDIFESFVAGMHNLFLEHNIALPDDKYDLAEDLLRKVATLEEDVLATAHRNKQLQEELVQKDIALKFKEMSEGLTMTEAEKFKALVEAKHFDSTEQFEQEAKIIRESYFKKEQKKEEQINEDIVTPAKEEQVKDPLMEQAVAALSRMNRGSKIPRVM